MQVIDFVQPFKIHKLQAIILHIPIKIYLFFLFALLSVTLPFIYLSYNRNSSTSAQAAGNTYYVSKNGNNVDGKTWQSAWNELANINWTVIQPGDTIIVDGGTTNMQYVSTLKPLKSGTATAPITIRMATENGRNGQIQIFGGRGTALPYCGQTDYVYQTTNVRRDGIDFGNVSYVTIDGTKWNGIQIYGHNYDGVWFNNTNSFDTLRNVEIFDNGTATQNSSTGQWTPDRPGIHPTGSNLTFEQINVHDNGQDGFQTGGPLNNLTIRHSWMYNLREMPGKVGTPFNDCNHRDGLQVYNGGDQVNYLFEDSVFGPGLMQGILLGDFNSSTSAPTATVNNVTIRNSLFIYAGGTNIMAHPDTKPNNWDLENNTIYNQYDQNYHNALYFEGANHQVNNSIVFGGKVQFPDGLAASAGNCQYHTASDTASLAGITADPQFVTNVDNFQQVPSLATLANADFSLQSTSPCLGKGSTMTSTAKLISTAISSQPTPTEVPTNTPTPLPTNTPTPAPTATPTPTSVTATFIPDADAFVQKSTASTNYGKATSLKVIAGTTASITYMRFDLRSLAGKKIKSAILHLTFSDGSAATQNIKSVASTTWCEYTGVCIGSSTQINYNNRPALGSVIATITGATTGKTKDINLTNFVAGKVGQLFSIGFDTASGDGISILSRETTAKPTLTVIYQ